MISNPGFFDHLSTFHASKARKRALEALRRFLGPNRQSLPADYMDQSDFLEAYQRYYLPLHLPELPWILDQAARLGLSPKPGSKVLDLGAGPGTLSHALSMWAGAHKIDGLEFTLVDRSQKALDLAKALLTLANPQVQSNFVKTDLTRISQLRGSNRFDWILAGHMLNEWGDDKKALETKFDFLEAVMRHLMHPQSVMVIVEPPLRDPTIDLMKIRDFWVRDLGGKVLLPCPSGTQNCPALRSRLGWCYSKVPRTWARTNGWAPLDKKVEEFLGQELHYNGFSYLVLAPSDADMNFFKGYTHPRRVAFSDERRKPSLWCREGRVQPSSRRPKHRGELLLPSP